MADGPAAIDVERAICRYLQDHPTARDTEAGICSWWLPDPPPAAALRLALERLVANGRLAARPASGGETVSGLAAAGPLRKP